MDGKQIQLGVDMPAGAAWAVPARDGMVEPLVGIPPKLARGAWPAIRRRLQLLRRWDADPTIANLPGDRRELADLERWLEWYRGIDPGARVDEASIEAGSAG